MSQSIDLLLNKYQYKIDEKIAGRVSLMLTGQVKATRLIVSLLVTKKISTSSISALGGVSFEDSNKNSRVYTFDLMLDGEKEYTNNTYEFEMSIPSEAYPQGLQPVTDSMGTLGKAISIMTRFSPLGQTKYIYQIEARLDIPWGIDLSKKVDITIG